MEVIERLSEEITSEEETLDIIKDSEDIKKFSGLDETSIIPISFANYDDKSLFFNDEENDEDVFFPREGYLAAGKIEVTNNDNGSITIKTADGKNEMTIFKVSDSVPTALYDGLVINTSAETGNDDYYISTVSLLSKMSTEAQHNEVTLNLLKKWIKEQYGDKFTTEKDILNMNYEEVDSLLNKMSIDLTTGFIDRYNSLKASDEYKSWLKDYKINPDNCFAFISNDRIAEVLKSFGIDDVDVSNVLVNTSKDGLFGSRVLSIKDNTMVSYYFVSSDYNQVVDGSYIIYKKIDSGLYDDYLGK